MKRVLLFVVILCFSCNESRISKKEQQRRSLEHSIVEYTKWAVLKRIALEKGTMCWYDDSLRLKINEELQKIHKMIDE